jgi:steroid delta-isomerase-like uncharacterized protein
MNKNQIQSFVARWLNAVTTGNFAEFEHLVAEDAVDPSTGQVTSRTAFRERAATVQRAFSELTGQVDELLVDGDRIAWRWTLTGIQRAPFLGETGSGKRVRLSGVNFQRLQGGLVTEHYTLFDALEALRQLR